MVVISGSNSRPVAEELAHVIRMVSPLLRDKEISRY